MLDEHDQKTIRCVLQRGGTSKGLYFRNEDLPVPGKGRDRLLQRLMGSPDVVQIDGLGGSRAITSKIAIVSPSQRHDADVDYTFVQVSITDNSIIYTGNCGNISSGVGPFAVDEGMVQVEDGNTRVRIYNTNTDAVIISDVPVRNGKARSTGSFPVGGVPGTGAEIVMNWVGTIGAKTGHLLPTGNAVDQIAMEDGSTIDASLVDAANPLVFVKASDFGLSGSELTDQIDGNADLLKKVAEARGKAAVLFGMEKDWKNIDQVSPGLPMLAFIAPPDDYKTLNGAMVAAKDIDLRVRVMFMAALHESTPGTGSICLAAASRVKGSVVEQANVRLKNGFLLLGTPSGVTPARVEAHDQDDAPGGIAFDMLGFSRTSRRLMDCNAYYPADLFDTLEDRDIEIQNTNVGVVIEE